MDRLNRRYDGLVAAQEPGTAQFDGMPGNAIATGLVDFVAPPEELLQKVCAALTAPPVAAASPNSEEPADPDALDAILWAVAKHAGVDFSDYKRSTLLRRIERRMRIAPVSTLAQYAERLADDAPEARTLQRELLIAEGIPVDQQGRLPLREHLWKPDLRSKPVNENSKQN